MTKVVNIVYGNHGELSYQIDDILLYLMQAISIQGARPRLCSDPVERSTNIIIENFNDSFREKIIVASRTPGTRIFCVATEFLTNGSFNNFSEKPRLSRLGRYLERKRGKKKKNAHYIHREKWERRYDNFQSVCDVVDGVFCIDQSQFTVYRDFFGTEGFVSHLPTAAIDERVVDTFQVLENKDVDFLFTGSLTPHREDLLTQLGQKGEVKVGPAAWSSLRREHFISRAKVNLDMRQSAEWQYSSCMRLHVLLCAGAQVAVEQSRFGSIQETCLGSFASEEYVKGTVALAKQSFGLQDAVNNYQAYWDASEDARKTINTTISRVLS